MPGKRKQAEIDGVIRETRRGKEELPAQENLSSERGYWWYGGPDNTLRFLSELKYQEINSVQKNHTSYKIKLYDQNNDSYYMGNSLVDIKCFKYQNNQLVEYAPPENFKIENNAAYLCNGKKVIDASHLGNFKGKQVFRKISLKKKFLTDENPTLKNTIYKLNKKPRINEIIEENDAYTFITNNFDPNKESKLINSFRTHAQKKTLVVNQDNDHREKYSFYHNEEIQTILRSTYDDFQTKKATDKYVTEYSYNLTTKSFIESRNVKAEEKKNVILSKLIYSDRPRTIPYNLFVYLSLKDGKLVILNKPVKEDIKFQKIFLRNHFIGIHYYVANGEKIPVILGCQAKCEGTTNSKTILSNRYNEIMKWFKSIENIALLPPTDNPKEYFTVLPKSTSNLAANSIFSESNRPLVETTAPLISEGNKEIMQDIENETFVNITLSLDQDEGAEGSLPSEKEGYPILELELDDLMQDEEVSQILNQFTK